MSNLKWQAWSKGDKAKPWDGDWLAEYHRRSIEAYKRLYLEPNSINIFWQKMPRNPGTSRYEQHLDLDDKAASPSAISAWRTRNSFVRLVQGRGVIDRPRSISTRTHCKSCR